MASSLHSDSLRPTDPFKGDDGTVPRLALTSGEPAGVGPDLLLQIAQRNFSAEIIVLAAPELLEARAKRLGLSIRLEVFDPTRARQPSPAGTLKVWPFSLERPSVCGHPDRANAAYVLETLRSAVTGCLNGHFDALITGPVHKGVINDAGFPFQGHTRFLAELTQTPEVVMMLVAPGLRVALATEHIPLREVSAALSIPQLKTKLWILYRDLQKRFCIAKPRISVCGLNPHAGEGGYLGREEIEKITPALEELRAEGLKVVGPLSADTAFTPSHLEQTDAVMAMYHDQGLPVLKHRSFGKAVNVTLGLPFIRTSVDHGTALELAGTGQAQSESLIAALHLALELFPLRS